MTESPLELVKLRNNFYRDNYRKLMTVLLASIATIVCLSGIVVYQVTHRPAPTYFATTSDGRIIKLVALNRPTIDNQALLTWATNAVTSSYSFNFINYRKQLQDSEQYFTATGYKGFMTGVEKNLESVKQKQLIVSAVPGGAPVIVNEGIVGNRYAWRVQMPMLVTYSGGTASQTYSNTQMVTMLIVRVSTLDSPEGIGIEQLNIAPAS